MKKRTPSGVLFYWLEKGLGGRIFRPASLGALWVLGISVNLSLYQLQRESLHNRAYARGNAPLLVPAAPLPPEGEVCSPLGLCSHKNRDGKHRANLPHRGRCRRQKGCISIGPQARFACFPRPTGRLPGFPSPLAHYRGFIQTGAAGARHNPLNPLNLLNLLNPHVQRACPKSRSAALPMHSFFLIFQMFIYLSA